MQAVPTPVTPVTPDPAIPGEPGRAPAVHLALGTAIVAIAFAAIFVRLAAPTHPLVIAGLRLAVAAAVFALPTLAAWRARRISARQCRRAALAGLLYALHFGAWIASLSLTSVAASVTLVTATPLFLALIAVGLRRDRPTPRLWWSIGVAALGLAILGAADLGGTAEALAGDGLALLGALAIALYMLVVRAEGEALDVVAFSGVAVSVGAVALFAVALLAGVPLAVPSAGAWGWIVLAALVPQVLGHTLMTWSLRHLTPTAVGIATVSEPVGATALGWLLLGETVGSATLLGCGVTLLGVLIAAIPARGSWRPGP